MMIQEPRRAHMRFIRDLIAIGVTFVLIAITVNAEPVTPMATDATEQKLSFSTGAFVDRRQSAAKRPAFNGVVQKRARTEVQQALTSDFEIFDAIVNLYYDDDNDGHYSGLEITFDADTDYAVADVFARLYLSFEGGPWEHFYTTDVFAIFGNSSDDSYAVDTELFSGYPTGYYDVLIELYDPVYDDYLAGLGPVDAPDLRDLPLEDQQKDSVFLPSPPLSISHGGGGATSLLSLTLLGLGGLYKRRLLRRTEPGTCARPAIRA